MGMSSLAGQADVPTCLLDETRRLGSNCNMLPQQTPC